MPKYWVGVLVLLIEFVLRGGSCDREPRARGVIVLFFHPSLFWKSSIVLTLCVPSFLSFSCVFIFFSFSMFSLSFSWCCCCSSRALCRNMSLLLFLLRLALVVSLTLFQILLLST